MFKDVRCNAFSFIIQLLFPSPAPSRNYSLHRYFHQSSRLGTTRKESIIARIITRRDFIQPILESHLLEKFQKFGGILKSVEDSGSKSVDTNSFFSRKGVPLNRHARSSRLASRGHPKTGQGRYGEEGVARGGKETERQLSRFQNRRVARARHSLGGHPCDLPEEFTGRPGSARAGSSPNLDSKARGEGTPDPDQPRNREPATLHGSGSSSGFLKPARTGAPLLPHSPSRAISNRFLIEGSRGGEELLLLSRGLKFTLGVCLSVDSFLEYSQTRFLLTRLNG